MKLHRGNTEILVGDTVRIIREGLQYSEFNTWAKKHKATGFKAGKYPEDLHALFKVVSIGEHSPEKNTRLLFLIEDDKGKQFIFAKNGITFVRRGEFFEKEEFEL